MVDNLELIEAYFNNELAQERKGEFDRRIISDPDFAEEVAFYLSLKQVAGQELREKRESFKLLYKQSKPGNHVVKPEPALLRKLWPWAAAAAVIAGIIFGWNVWLRPVSLPGLANKYIKDNFQILPVTMGSREDSLQTGLRYYNEGKSEEALKHFESIALRDSSLSDVKKYTGIVYLRLGQYEQAIKYFSQLEKDNLFANPGKFYHALTLMKRDRPGDKQQAKILLEQVVQNELEGKVTAQEWLEKL